VKKLKLDATYGETAFSFALPDPKNANYAESKSVLDAELTPLGVVLLLYEIMLATPHRIEPQNAVFRYCEHINQRGFGKSAQTIFLKISKMSLWRGKRWIKSTFMKYASDDDELANFLVNGDKQGL
jgi:hypothetical protein